MQNHQKDLELESLYFLPQTSNPTTIPKFYSELEAIDNCYLQTTVMQFEKTKLHKRN